MTVNNDLILCLDGGYSSAKVLVGRKDGTILKKFKFPSLIGKVENNRAVVMDTRVKNYNGMNYYVGEDAFALESKKLIDLTNYAELEYYMPLVIYHTCMLIGEIPSTLVIGLSKAQIVNSGHFVKAMEKFVINGINIEFKTVKVYPQGVPSKVTLDKYGLNYPSLNTDFLDTATYIGVDIGFNTLDIFQCINGESSANLAEGIENFGIMKVAQDVQDLIYEKFQKQITLKEATKVIDSGVYSLRGNDHILTDEVRLLKEKYVAEIKSYLEQVYGDVLDNSKNLYLLGGGSALFRDLEDDFIKVPKNDNEYYNVLGFFLTVCK